MEQITSRVAQILAVIAFVALVIAVITKLSGGMWLATPSGWLQFATACAVVGLAARFCWLVPEAR